MNETTIPSTDELAAIAYNFYYFDYDTDIDLSDQIASADDLADDIRDMLHNANDADLFPFTDDLTLDDATALSHHLLTDDTALDNLTATLELLIRARLNA